MNFKLLGSFKGKDKRLFPRWHDYLRLSKWLIGSVQQSPSTVPKGTGSMPLGSRLEESTASMPLETKAGDAC